jgi:hypothetical protein
MAVKLLDIDEKEEQQEWKKKKTTTSMDEWIGNTINQSINQIIIVYGLEIAVCVCQHSIA